LLRARCPEPLRVATRLVRPRRQNWFAVRDLVSRSTSIGVAGRRCPRHPRLEIGLAGGSGEEYVLGYTRKEVVQQMSYHSSSEVTVRTREVVAT
jgi:hypothetical protein